SAVLLMTYGVGACVGPMIAGVLMSLAGHSMYYVFISACALILVWQVRPTRVTGAHQVDEAPVHFVPMPDTLQSSPAAAVLDPRVDVENDISIEMVQPDPAAALATPPVEGAGAVDPPGGATEAVEAPRDEPAEPERQARTGT
ncbi:MFS transporter, partial [Achromobacter xylosoxidans]